ncbi:right-handed parallel beta-helix repeat-containing protein [Oceanobacillus timonensis]|uniref:right-handed parallel beta-helix repeat-containing protein n=1 Tax=Oceanobacillus timonensis TaxID=1926285 RepID=UPI0009B9A15C|nr:right-handed parallel beta-helix repeat-containing protein [Oceanobacillus timonensis]
MKRMGLFMIAVCAAAGVLFAVYSFYSTDQAIYVAVDGSDRNEGTLERPFQTIAKASAEAEAGTTVYIREGTYKEPLVVQHSGTEHKPITFQAYEEEEVILDGENLNAADGNLALVVLEGKNDINIEGLTFKNVTTGIMDETVMGIFITGSSSHITVKNNTVQGIKTWHKEGNGHGIAVYGTDSMKDINIIDNIVEDLKLGTSESIVLNGDIDGFAVDGNTIQYSDNIGIDLIGYEGVANNPAADYVRNGTVQNNTVHHVSSFTNPAYDGEYSAAAIYVDGGKDILIKKNELYENDIGIEATSEHAGKYAENIQMTDNLISNNFYTGIAIGGYDEERGGTRNTLMMNNTLYHNDMKDLDGGQLLLQYNVHDNEIKENKFTAGPSRIFIANFFRENRDNYLGENMYYREQDKKGIWIWKDEEYNSFSAFKKASGSDETSQYVDAEK